MVVVTADDLHQEKLDRIERDFDRELDQSRHHELEWIRTRRSDSFSSPTEYLENIRTKLKNGYNQLMQVDEN